MKDSTAKWIAFAEENLGCSQLVVESAYYNASLQNAQQAVEKALKALVIEKDLEFRIETEGFFDLLVPFSRLLEP